MVEGQAEFSDATRMPHSLEESYEAYFLSSLNFFIAGFYLFFMP
jgi:hypothetical protein